MKTPFVICTVAGADAISSEMAEKRSVRDRKMTKGRFPGILRSSTESVEDGNEVAEEEEGEVGHEYLINN